MSDTSLDPIAEARRKAQELAKLVVAQSNGGEDASRKRPLEDQGFEGPDTKKPTVDGFGTTTTPTSIMNAQAIAQAAVSKLAGEFGFQQNMSIEIKIPNRMVGLVIGRGGEMITKLQAESGAKIQVAPDGTEVNGERQVSISGMTETVEKAKTLVSKVIEDAGGATSLPATMNLLPGQEVVELMVPATKVGLIIGKGGEMIKMLQERAGCKMQMIQDGPYASAPEKPLRMTGFPENCKKARQYVLELLEQKELEARGLIDADYTQGVPSTIELNVSKDLVGFIIGRNGEHIVNIQNTCNVRLQFQNDIPGTSLRTATISGQHESCLRAKQMVEEMVAERTQHGVKPRLDLPNPTGPGVTSVQVPIPANKCGLIIGRGGDTIRQLQVQSGAQIALDTSSQDPNEKLFNVKGTPQSIQLAQQLISQKLEGGVVYPGQPNPAGLPFPTPVPPVYQGGAGFPGQPQMGNSPWQGQYGYAAGGANYPPGYGGNPSQQQPDQAQAWNAYYQWAAQQQQNPSPQPGQPRPQTQPPGPGGMPSGGAGGGGQSGDLQAQWAEYYRQLGYFYGQQPQGGGGGGNQPTGPPGEQK